MLQSFVGFPTHSPLTIPMTAGITRVRYFWEKKGIFVDFCERNQKKSVNNFVVILHLGLYTELNRVFKK